jgi:hypothetical protein
VIQYSSDVCIGQLDGVSNCMGRVVGLGRL